MRSSRGATASRLASSRPGASNRFFAHAATANGLIESPGNLQMMAAFLRSRFRMRTIYDNLMARGFTWAVYYGDHSQAYALSNLHRHARDGFRPLEAFARDVAGGTLPDYCFLEPQYVDLWGAPASDQHPPHDVRAGEAPIACVYGERWLPRESGNCAQA